MLGRRRRLDLGLLSVCFLHITLLCGINDGQEKRADIVVAQEGQDAILPCISRLIQNLETDLFNWRKENQMQVFFYHNGYHYSNSLSGQDPQFVGRVSHFAENLKDGNASIMIRDVQLADHGNYICLFPGFPRLQSCHVELIVEPILKDRSGIVAGAAPRPHITILDSTQDAVLLQCEVQDVFPKAKVEVLDSAGIICPSEETQNSERNGLYITILTAMKKSDRVRCVVTQEEIHHQVSTETYVPFCGDTAPRSTEKDREQEKEQDGVGTKSKVEQQPGNVRTDSSGGGDAGWWLVRLVLGGLFLTAALSAVLTSHCIQTQRDKGSG